MARRTKIVATIGPASDSVEMLASLMDAGVDVMRLNLSHGSIEGHLELLALIREVAEGRGHEIAVLADLPGPKIRAGAFTDGGVELAAGESIELWPGDGSSDRQRIWVPYAPLLADLEVGARVQLGDGAVSMSVLGVGDECATARIETGGRASGRPGVHLSSDTLHIHIRSAFVLAWMSHIDFKRNETSKSA